MNRWTKYTSDLSVSKNAIRMCNPDITEQLIGIAFNMCLKLTYVDELTPIGIYLATDDWMLRRRSVGIGTLIALRNTYGSFYTALEMSSIPTHSELTQRVYSSVG